MDARLQRLSARLGHAVHGIMWRDGMPWFIEHDGEADLGVRA